MDNKYLVKDKWMPKNFDTRLRVYKDYGNKTAANTDEFRTWLSYIIHGLRSALNKKL